MTRVEVEASPLGIKCVYHGGHVPNRGSHVLLVVVVTRLHAILFAEADEATKLAGSLLEFSPHVDHLILVIARLEEWYRMFGGDRQDCARRRVVRRSDLCGDHRDVQSLFADGGHGFGEVFRSEEHTSELQSRFDLVCRLLLEKKKKKIFINVCTDVQPHTAKIISR